MKLAELAARVGVGSYPEAAEAIYAALPEDDGALYNVAYLRELEEEYQLLGEYYSAVERAAIALAGREELCLWGRLMLAYIRTVGEGEIRRLPINSTDGTPAADMLPMLVLLQEVPAMVARYRARGFRDEEIRRTVKCYGKNIAATEREMHRPMLDAGHYSWLLYYVMAGIFDHKAFNFQPASFGGGAILFRHRESGEYRFMMTAGRFHRSGRQLGSIGCEEEEGAFDAEFSETADGFGGHLVEGGLVLPERVSLSASLWECVLRPGDPVVNLHIPRGADLTPAYVEESLREGLARTRHHFPERAHRAIACYSWLMDPTLSALLGGEGKLAHFSDLFTRFPLRDMGRACHWHVFPGYEGRPLAEYPEDTSLRRKLKAHLMDGRYVYSMGGVILDTLEW